MATRYHDFKNKPVSKDLIKQLRSISADIILKRAKFILGSIVHPVEKKMAPLNEVPFEAQNLDFEIEETLENFPYLETHHLSLLEQDIWMSYSQRKNHPLVLCVDTSLSMTGEKLALTAVAIAVVLLEFPDDPIGVIAFENQAKILKSPEEKISIATLVERFLDVPAHGYTHLEEGMKLALKTSVQASRLGNGKRTPVVLLTDGKYTAGRDPAYLAPRFSRLILLKMGKEQASYELCQELAKKGKGELHEVGELENLPSVMYKVVKNLLRN